MNPVFGDTVRDEVSSHAFYGCSLAERAHCDAHRMGLHFQPRGCVVVRVDRRC
jgi:hypothetical protein